MRPHRTLAAFVVLALGTASACAVNVRGRADIRTSATSYPMNKALVELCAQAGKQCQTYTTGYDGMYYFTVDPGTYVVRINGTVRKEIVIPDVPTFDIPWLPGN